MSEALLAHLGLPAPPAPDLAGLRRVHRAYLARVPYEDLAVQLGESGPLDEAALIARVLGGRGGYCFELNTVLAALLRGCGFTVTHHEAVVGGEGPTNHMALLVHLDDGPWIADAGLGEGFVEPLPLREGRHELGPLWWTLEREPGGTWWLGAHEWGSVTGFRLWDPPVPVAAFEPHHRRLSSDPESSFVKTLVVQRPHTDCIVTLRSRTLTVRGPAVDERTVLERDAFDECLRHEFGLVLDDARLARVWALAQDQHAAFVAP